MLCVNPLLTRPQSECQNVVVNDNTADLEGTITVSEAARRLGRSIEQVRRYLREGKLKGRRIGQQWFIEEAALRRIHKPVAGGRRRIREAVATMYTTRAKREDVENLIARVNARREAIRRRLGRELDIDIVEMLRIDREEH